MVWRNSLTYQDAVSGYSWAGDGQYLRRRWATELTGSVRFRAQKAGSRTSISRSQIKLTRPAVRSNLISGQCRSCIYHLYRRRPVKISGAPVRIPNLDELV